MPRIKKNQQQEKALATINTSLLSISAINSIMKEINNETGVLELRCTNNEKAKQKSNRYTFTSVGTGHVVNALNKERNALIKQVNHLAAKYSILLDPEDLKILKEEDVDSAEVNDANEPKETIPQTQDPESIDEDVQTSFDLAED